MLARSAARALRAAPRMRAYATQSPKIEHHSPAEVAPPPPPGVAVDPQLHGYPQLPEVSLQTREPFGWWDIQERKNFGEIVMEEEDRLGMWGPDVHAISPGRALLQLSVALSLVGVFGYVIYNHHLTSPAAPRSYPYGGLEKALGGVNAARVEEPEIDE